MAWLGEGESSSTEDALEPYEDAKACLLTFKRLICLPEASVPESRSITDSRWKGAGEEGKKKVEKREKKKNKKENGLSSLCQNRAAIMSVSPHPFPFQLGPLFSHFYPRTGL
jgi:hypothetical protein